jgi:hypothetical protein
MFQVKVGHSLNSGGAGTNVLEFRCFRSVQTLNIWYRRCLFREGVFAISSLILGHWKWVPVFFLSTAWLSIWKLTKSQILGLWSPYARWTDLKVKERGQERCVVDLGRNRLVLQDFSLSPVHMCLSWRVLFARFMPFLLETSSFRRSEWVLWWLPSIETPHQHASVWVHLETSDRIEACPKTPIANPSIKGTWSISSSSRRPTSSMPESINHTCP